MSFRPTSSPSIGVVRGMPASIPTVGARWALVPLEGECACRCVQPASCCWFGRGGLTQVRTHVHLLRWPLPWRPVDCWWLDHRRSGAPSGDCRRLSGACRARLRSACGRWSIVCRGGLSLSATHRCLLSLRFFSFDVRVIHHALGGRKRDRAHRTTMRAAQVNPCSSRPGIPCPPPRSGRTPHGAYRRPERPS